MLTKEELEKIHSLLDTFWYRELDYDYRDSQRMDEILDMQNAVQRHLDEAFPEETLQAQVEELENWVMSHGVVIEE